MSPVERFDPEHEERSPRQQYALGDSAIVMEPYPDGEWVKAEDYQKLSERLKEAEQKYDELWKRWDRMISRTTAEAHNLKAARREAEAALEAERQRVLDELLSEKTIEAAGSFNWYGKQVSSGLVRAVLEVALQSLTQEKPCETCGGRGFRTGGVFPRCPVCKGTGKDPDCTETPSEDNQRNLVAREYHLAVIRSLVAERKAIEAAEGVTPERREEILYGPSGGAGEKPVCEKCQGKGFRFHKGFKVPCHYCGEKPVESGDGLWRERAEEYRDALRQIETEPVTGSQAEWVAWAREFASVVLSDLSPEPVESGEENG